MHALGSCGGTSESCAALAIFSCSCCVDVSSPSWIARTGASASWRTLWAPSRSAHCGRECRVNSTCFPYLNSNAKPEKLPVDNTKILCLACSSQSTSCRVGRWALTGDPQHGWPPQGHNPVCPIQANWGIKTRIQERSSTDCNQIHSWLITKIICAKYPCYWPTKNRQPRSPPLGEMRERKRAEIALAKS